MIDVITTDKNGLIYNDYAKNYSKDITERFIQTAKITSNSSHRVQDLFSLNLLILSFKKAISRKAVISKELSCAGMQNLAPKFLLYNC